MTEILEGIGASPGEKKGNARIILDISDINTFKKGEILISIITNPLYIAALIKASALITDIGGVTSHSAVIARELGIPAVVGTGNATKIIKDGETIIVNGTKGRVYRDG